MKDETSEATHARSYAMRFRWWRGTAESMRKGSLALFGLAAAAFFVFAAASVMRRYPILAVLLSSSPVVFARTAAKSLNDGSGSPSRTSAIRRITRIATTPSGRMCTAPDGEMRLFPKIINNNNEDIN